MTADRILAFLLREGLAAGNVALKQLKGGYLNAVWRADTGQRRLVVKAFAEAPGATLFPNLPADEAAALDRLADLQVAPDPVGFWPKERLLVYAYVDGSQWQGDPGPVASLLLRKEAADPAGFRAVPWHPAAVMAEGDALFARCTAPAPPRPVASDLPPPNRLSLIHTDIGPGNLVGRDSGLRLIDWQCPAAGDLAEDVLSFLSPAFQILSGNPPLTPDQRTLFWRAMDRPDLRNRCAALRPAHAWRMAAYCLWRAETRAEADIRARYRAAHAAEITHMDAADAD